MDYGRYSNKYSGRHGRTERETKKDRRERKTVAALVKLQHKVLMREAHAQAKEKAKGNVGVFLDEIKRFFTRRAS